MTTPTTDDLDILSTVAELSGLSLVAARVLRSDAGPGGMTTGFAVTLGDDSGATVDHVIYVETTPEPVERPGVLRLQDESGDERAVWVYPHDPALPALADVVVPARAHELLSRAGWAIDDVPSLELVAYRPSKRAVVHVSWPHGEVFVKTTTARMAERIERRHAAWRAAGLPVPPVLHRDEGTLVLARQEGDPASARLDALDPERFLDALDALRAQAATVPSSSPARASLASRAHWYAERVAARAPELAGRATALADAIQSVWQHAPGAQVTIHGDLHVGQLFVDPADPSHVVGVIDIDTAGLGDPADDDAALWAHLVATEAMALRAGDAATAAAASALTIAAEARWTRREDGGERIRAIAAAHLLGHALTRTIDPADAVRRGEDLLTAAS